MNEPLKEALWRKVLNWGAVIYFLLIPAIVMIYGMAGIPTSNPQRAAFIGSFHHSITAIVAALAGLNSWDKRSASNGGSKK